MLLSIDPSTMAPGKKVCMTIGLLTTVKIEMMTGQLLEYFGEIDNYVARFSRHSLEECTQ